ncbi:uncharacterized protein BDR25DRAFT_222077, partial [Lindgomyces ingoldianus]
TYYNYYKNRLFIKTLLYNLCLLITYKGLIVFSITGLQTDNTLSIVTANFA